ncbi:MAG TPA: alpha/beta-type small acid-soluble spore protein [Clostridiaceae bacterium]|nr:alpha/beta-type small acid-soluble spore protein [Clostridiaceae bacterium]
MARNNYLVPGAEDAMKRLKLEAAKEIGHLQYCKEFNDHYKGDLPSRVNGAQGGPIGGQMVKKLIKMAQEQL